MGASDILKGIGQGFQGIAQGMLTYEDLEQRKKQNKFQEDMIKVKQDQVKAQEEQITIQRDNLYMKQVDVVMTKLSTYSSAGDEKGGVAWIDDNEEWLKRIGLNPPRLKKSLKTGIGNYKLVRKYSAQLQVENPIPLNAQQIQEAQAAIDWLTINGHPTAKRMYDTFNELQQKATVFQRQPKVGVGGKDIPTGQLPRHAPAGMEYKISGPGKFSVVEKEGGAGNVNQVSPEEVDHLMDAFLTSFRKATNKWSTLKEKEQSAFLKYIEQNPLTGKLKEAIGFADPDIGGFESARRAIAKKFVKATDGGRPTDFDFATWLNGILPNMGVTDAVAQQKLDAVRTAMGQMEPNTNPEAAKRNFERMQSVGAAPPQPPSSGAIHDDILNGAFDELENPPTTPSPVPRKALEQKQAENERIIRKNQRR